MMEIDNMEIFIEGGMIQKIIDIPDGLEIIINDYDIIDSEFDESLYTDKEGNRCVRYKWK